MDIVKDNGLKSSCDILLRKQQRLRQANSVQSTLLRETRKCLHRKLHSFPVQKSVPKINLFVQNQSLWLDITCSQMNGGDKERQRTKTSRQSSTVSICKIVSHLYLQSHGSRLWEEKRTEDTYSYNYSSISAKMIRQPFLSKYLNTFLKPAIILLFMAMWIHGMQDLSSTTRDSIPPSG